MRPPTATPRYAEIPRWGLLDPPPAPEVPQRRSLGWFADRVRALLAVTAMMFALATIAEACRYGVLLYNRTRLLDPLLLAVSDAAVWTTSLVAQATALCAALGAVGWLIQARAAEFARHGRTEPRRVPVLVIGSLLPVVNLVAPGLFLTELVRRRPRTDLARVRTWWAGWIFGTLMWIAALAWHSADTLQAQANGVLFTALTNAVASAVAVLTLWTIHALEGRDLLGRPHRPERWLPATGPARPVIEPIRGVPATASTAEADTADSAKREADIEATNDGVVADDTNDEVEEVDTDLAKVAST
ncbi:MAG: DUF4328 domain-containing protein [Aldersonia sp.]|nr:DUF4328 domain-containing protein [Aldersonia sp.]